MATRYRFEVRPYRRAFRRSLHTHHGEWRDRTGLVLKLTNAEGVVSFGEIAPVPWFGSEGLDEALAFCLTLPPEMGPDEMSAIPPTLPACQFGIEMAWQMQQPSRLPAGEALPLPISTLLPTGAAALESWPAFWQRGSRTFKWKIGVADFTDERSLLLKLVQALPPEAQLRLDANGGLCEDTACRWLELCESLNPIEFVEQPLPPTELDTLLALSRQFSTPLALDESVATLTQLEACIAQGWSGLVVLKPAIAGSPQRLCQICQQAGLDVVWSSVFEGAIARQFIQTRLIPSVGGRGRAIGFGIDHWFAPSVWDDLDFERLWQSL